MPPDQKHKKPWQKPEIRVLSPTPEEKARLFPDHFRTAKEVVAAR
jgi:hypothetical protein